MSEIKHIRKRISARRKAPGPRAYEAPGSPLFTLIYGLAMLAMVGASLGLGWMINEKQQWVDPKPVLQQIEVLSEKLHLKPYRPGCRLKSGLARSSRSRRRSAMS